MFGLGTNELIVIGIVVFFIFGAKRLPEIGKGLGGAIREFKNVKKDLSLKEPNSSDEGKEEEGGEDKTTALEDKLAQKVMGQVPGVKKAMDVKEKVEKVKKIID
ncbi:MAG: twin-arginine translocase TatA/TatE family subunit [Pseudomonadota bacterium]